MAFRSERSLRRMVMIFTAGLLSGYVGRLIRPTGEFYGKMEPESTKIGSLRRNI